MDAYTRAQGPPRGRVRAFVDWTARRALPAAAVALCVLGLGAIVEVVLDRRHERRQAGGDADRRQSQRRVEREPDHHQAIMPDIVPMLPWGWQPSPAPRSQAQLRICDA